MSNIELTPGNIKGAMKEAGATSADLWQVAYEDIHILPGFNVREKDPAYREHIEYLAGSIVANGYMRDKPMAGYVASVGGKNRIIITDGHCRYEAIALARAQGAEIIKVPVVVKPSGTSVEDLMVALVTSNSGKPLTPFELGTVCKRLVGFGWDEKQIAGRLNITDKYVGDLLFLHSCPNNVRKMVQQGQVSAGTAISAVKKHGDKAAEVLGGAVEKAAAKGKEKATAKDLVPEWKKMAKKRGPGLYSALLWVKEDASYKKLSEATRQQIERIIEGMPEDDEE